MAQIRPLGSALSCIRERAAGQSAQTQHPAYREERDYATLLHRDTHRVRQLHSRLLFPSRSLLTHLWTLLLTLFFQQTDSFIDDLGVLNASSASVLWVLVYWWYKTVQQMHIWEFRHFIKYWKTFSLVCVNLKDSLTYWRTIGFSLHVCSYECLCDCARR